MTENSNNDAKTNNSSSKTLTLGLKGKKSLEQIKEGIEQKSLVIKGRSIVEVVSKNKLTLKSNLGELPKLGQLAKKPDTLVEQSEANLEHSDTKNQDALTDKERKSRLVALQKAKESSKELNNEPNQVVGFNVVESPVTKDEVLAKKEKKAATFKDTAKEEETEEEISLKKKSSTKKKERNESERAWKDAYYEEELEEELEEEADVVIYEESIVEVPEEVKPVIQQTNFVNTNIRRVGKTKRDKYGNKHKEKKEVIITGQESVKSLAHALGEKLKDFLSTLNKLEVEADENTVLDIDVAELAVLELGHIAKKSNKETEIIALYKFKDNEKDLEPRPPVVTIMGHVDHGKTTLLDYIRKANVAAKESGGITQHIGAYQIVTASGKKITFLDTPGHEAFAEMRARGAQVTDIIVLVVAADDGLKQQSIEVINHANSANVPIIVAVNKIDKEGVNSSKVKTELLQHNVVVEEMGGKVLSTEVSALKGIGINDLLENILLEAELLDLKANKNRNAIATVIESKLEKGKGIVATVIVQNGTLKQGDLFVIDNSIGKVRLLSDENGKQLKAVTPGTPVEVTGFNIEVKAGDELIVVNSEADAKKIINYKQTSANLVTEETDDISLLLSTKEDVSQLSIILKADVYGSKEAILGALLKIGNEEVKIKVVHSGVGAITESDILLAKSTGAIIYGFNVRANNQAKTLANSEKINIRYFSVIYDLLDDLKESLSGLLQPKIIEKFIGYAEVKEVFNVSKIGKIAGCVVTEGIVKKSAGVRLLRNNVVIYEGMLLQLKRFKDDAKEVNSGQECGIMLQNFQDIAKGDVIECFEKTTENRSL